MVSVLDTNGWSHLPTQITGAGRAKEGQDCSSASSLSALGHFLLVTLGLHQKITIMMLRDCLPTTGSLCQPETHKLRGF